jgi:TolB-like protein/cytochrome c-type biogenesis protein CcmH/NrfG
MSQHRQLAAIMFTDIRGYTSMMQEDENRAINIRARHRQVFNSITEKHKGKILQYYGDGTLSIFDSAIEAVKCGIDLQLEYLKDPVIPVRIGIHTGDIIYSNEEVIGDGVNVASRIESLAIPGSVLISAKVYDEIINQSNIETKPLSTFELKNVAKPIEVFAISNKGLIVPNVDEIKGKTKDSNSNDQNTTEKKHPKTRKKKSSWILYSIIGLIALVAGYFIYENISLSEQISNDVNSSIAVLAFDNMSDDPNQEYFSDGISEEILNSLVKVEGLNVAGRTSSFSFKGKDKDIQTIGDKLGVGLVLEGSVRKSENRVRITTQLINASNGYHIWSEQYERELEDIFTIQEEIASSIVNKLKLTVLKTKSPKQPTNNLIAYDLYLKGLHSLSLDVEGFVEALNYFQKAIALDPKFALAYAGLGDAYVNASGYGLIPLDKAMVEARKAAKKSISLDSKQAYGHHVLASIYLFYDWDWEAAKLEYEKALDLGLANPDHFIIWYEALLYENFDDAISNAKIILERDPLSIDAHWFLGISYYLGRRYNEAIESFQDALRLNPDYSEAYRGIGTSYFQLKMYEESLRALEKALQLTQDQGPAVMDILAVLGASGQKEKLRGRLDELHEIRKQHTVPPIVFAIGYAYLGNMDEAFKWLEETYNERFFWLLSIKIAPDWDVFRNDPRFEEFIKRMNYPEAN